ncbi:hypothetical protein [Methylobacterium komagatae]
MFGLLKRKPSTLRLMADAIDEARRQASERIIGEASLLVDEAFNGVERVVGDHRARVDKALADGMTPLHLATLLARNYASQELSTGRHMVYRGVPSMSGQGYLAVFCWASDRLAELGDRSIEDARQEQAEVRAMLKEVG